MGSEFGRVHAEHRRQQTCHGGCTRGADRFAIDLMAVVTGLFRAGGRYEGLRLLGISDNGVAFHALRQNRPVGVEDLATPSLQRHRDGAALRGGWIRHAQAKTANMTPMAMVFVNRFLWNIA